MNATKFVLIFPAQWKDARDLWETVLNSECGSLAQAEGFLHDRRANGEAFDGEQILELESKAERVSNVNMLDMLGISMEELRHLENRVAAIEAPGPREEACNVFCARLQAAAMIYTTNKLQDALDGVAATIDSATTRTLEEGRKL
jgi:hypothetical protein